MARNLSPPLIIAHRGDVSAAPENTLPAFESALKAGADGIELDVRLTRDNRLVAIHDRTLNRTTSGRGMVDHQDLDVLQRLDAGSWFSPAFSGEPPPSLEQIFQALPRDFLINVEMKVIIKGMKLIAQKVADVVQRYRRWDSTLVASFNPVALYHLWQIEPGVARGYIYSKSHPYPIRARWLSPVANADWYDPTEYTYDPNTHRKFQRQGKRVLAWDLDFNQDWQAIVDSGVDAVVTDDLARLVRQKRDRSSGAGRTEVPVGRPAATVKVSDYRAY